MDIVAVNIKTITIYDFLKDGETEAELLERVKENKGDEAADYKIMTWTEFEALQRDKILGNNEVDEITAEKFEEMLSVLPPLKWCERDGIEMFCISEMTWGSYTSQYAHDKRTDKYYSKMVDVLDQSTWIDKFIR